MDGYQVAHQLRNHPVTENIPILMFTAKSTVNDKITGFQAGADDYLTKPIHPAELITRVKALRQRQARVSMKQKKGRTISFLPTKGGIGTTTLALNTALTLKQIYPDEKVALVELRAGSATLALQLNITAGGGLQKLLQRKLPHLNKDIVMQQMIRHSSGMQILFSKASPEGSGPKLTTAYVRTLLHHLNAEYDYVLLDLPLSVTTANTEALREADAIIMTLAPHQIGLRMAEEMLISLDRQSIGAHKAKIVLINLIPAISSLNRNTVEQRLQREMICSIPSMPDLAYESTQTGRAMVTIQPKNLVSQQVRLVVQSITKSS